MPRKSKTSARKPTSAYLIGHSTKQAFKDLSIMKSGCTKSRTYGWLLNYPSTIIAALVTPEESTIPKMAVLHFYLSRIINGIAICLLLYRILCLQSNNHELFRPGIATLFGLCLSPLFIQQSFTVTADVPVNLFAIFLFGLMLFEERWNKWDWFSFAIVGILACTSKPVIFPVILPFTLFSFLLRTDLLAPWKATAKKFLKSPNFWIGLALTVLAIFVTLTQVGSDEGKPVNPGTNINEQLAYTKNHLWDVFGYLNDIVIYIVNKPEIFGPKTFIGYFDIGFTKFEFKFFEVAFAILLVSDFVLFWLTAKRNFLSMKTFGKSFVTRKGLVVGSFFLVCLFASYVGVLLPIIAMYLTWTKVGAQQVGGVQVRYFFCFLICIVGLVASYAYNQQGQLPKAPGDDKTVDDVKTPAVLLSVLLIALLPYLLGILFGIAKRYY